MLLLGIEGGATHTTVLLVDQTGAALRDFTLGPSNVLLSTDADLAALFLEIRKGLEGAHPDAICAGLAGVRGDSERQRVRNALEGIWPGVPGAIVDDLQTALAAVDGSVDAAARVLVLSGTGSCCYGEGKNGETAKVGGRGHVLGDRGSACDIGRRGLRGAMEHYDRAETWPETGRAILAALCLNDPESLIPWSMEAGKSEIAALAVPVFAAWKHGCPVASRTIEEAADHLAEDAVACARRLVEENGETVQFVLSGGTLRKQPEFAAFVSGKIVDAWPGAEVVVASRAGTWGALALAAEVFEKSEAGQGSSSEPAETFEASLAGIASSPTERRNPRSLNLDQLTVREGIELMVSEDRRLPDAVLEKSEDIAWLVERVVASFESGGRLFYVGAGTSGRLGVLDASECPPTFRSPAEQVQGIIAGGYRALWTPVEGAEDDARAGAASLQFREVGENDTVVGIAASGRTPFVHGALAEAKARSASTALLCFNPAVVISPESQPDRLLALDVGPEILTGSTRLKAGTATKMVLNIVTTLAMVRTGKVISNLMVDVDASNGKLRDRAIRIVVELTGVEKAAASEALRAVGWSIREACQKLEAHPLPPNSEPGAR